MNAPALHPGAVFDGRYHLEARVDDFGVGESWRARDAVDHASVIVKVLPAFTASERAHIARFNDLGRALVAVRHRAILATLRHGVASGVPYLVHEDFAGVSLAKGFALARTGRHLLAPGVLANLLDRACEAVAAAHGAAPPRVHGGLMPGSIVAAMIAGRFDVRVLDFGLATIFGDRLKVARATEYMAPSLEDDPERATPADDVFALGSIVMEAVTDRREAEKGGGTVGNLSAVAKRRADVPAGLMTLATRATKLDARQRFADVASLREALAAAWAPEVRPTRDDSPPPPSGIAGVAAEYTSWVRFADGDAPDAIAPVAPIAAPQRFEAPPPAAAFVAPAVDLSATQPVARGPAEELLGATTKMPSKHAAPQPVAVPPTQLLTQFEAPPAYAPPAAQTIAQSVYSPPVAAPAYAPPAYPAPAQPQPPQRVWGAAPTAPAHVEVTPKPSRAPMVIAVGVVIALAALALVAFFALR